MPNPEHRTEVLKADWAQLAPLYSQEHVAREWARILTEELGPNAGARA
jgi:hypothetical protein